MTTLSPAERALGRDVLRLLAAIRDGDRPVDLDPGALPCAVHAGLATVDYYDAVQLGGQGITLALTPEGMATLCLAEHGGVAMPSP